MSTLPMKISEILVEDSQYETLARMHPAPIMINNQRYPGRSKFDIVVFPAIDWDFRHQRTQHLLSRLARKGHRVFYLTASLRPLDQDFTVKKIIDNVFELRLNVPYSCGIYDGVLEGERTDQLIKSLDSAIKSLDIKGVSYVIFPTWAPVVLKLRELYGWKFMYSCIDAYSKFSNVSKQREEEERLLIRESDLTVTSSSYLYRMALGIRNDKVLHLPNACEFHHFSVLPPNQMIRTRGPVIGYIGAINDWFDAGLVEFLVARKPGWSFVFIGEVDDYDAHKLRQFSNVHMLGEKKYYELPKFIYHFDVCIIPFKQIPLIEATDPVKFYEYLASGKPVVSTKIPELEPYSKLCYIAENREDFLKKIETALNERSLQLINDRIDFARQNTWKSRVDTLYPHLKKLAGFLGA